MPEPTAAEIVRLLQHIDGQLGLAVYRSEGSRNEWKKEAADLIVQIRAMVAELSTRSDTSSTEAS